MDVTMEEDDIDMDLEEAATPVTPAPIPVMPTTSPIATPTITTSTMKGSQRRLDPKLLDKPEPYDGAEIGWRIWKLRVVGWLSAVDGRYRQLTGEAERSEIVLDNIAEEIVGLDTFLHTQLLVWLEGEQLETLLRGPEYRGWRTLVRAQERLETARKIAQLEKLLHPDFGDRASWRRKWLA